MCIKTRNLVFTMIAVAVLFSAVACSSNIEKPVSVDVPDVTGIFNVEILDIGKADAIILTSLNHTVLIDCGEKGDGDEVLDCLYEKNIDEIDYMFITHFDKDHVGGAKKILNNMQVKKIITPDYEGTNNEYTDFIEAIKENNLSSSVLENEMSFVLDDVLYEIYPPQKNSYEEGDNDYSIVIKTTHGENTFLFAGDAEEERLAELDIQMDLDSDFLKVPHHGNYNENTKKFIQEVSPLYAVITCSEKNPASQNVIDLLNSCNCSVFLTQNGDVSVASDGTTIQITQ